MEKILEFRDCGTMRYAEAFELQKKLHEQRKKEEIPDTFLFLEHPPVYTLGKRADEADVLKPYETLKKDGFDIEATTRGGQVTYHGPGQLIVYLIVNLYHAHRELRLFVENLEKSVCDYLKTDFGLEAHIEKEHPGVWVFDNKIAALGIAVHDKVTMHGLALNINPNLQHFKNIISCGIRDKGQCSVQSLTGKTPSIDEVKKSLADTMAKTYGYKSYRWIS